MKSFRHTTNDNEQVSVHYISPIDFVKFILENAPELVFGGHSSVAMGQQQLKAFWNNYEKTHPTHLLFSQPHPHRRRENTLCFSLHGDEGRGLKKGNTVILTWESNLGIETAANYTCDNRLDQCRSCHLGEACAQRFNTAAGFMPLSDMHQDPSPSSYETHNTGGNSFLTKFVLAALPNSLYKETNALDIVLENIVNDFRTLFESGVEVAGVRFFCATTGLKGDLRWYEKVANLVRCFNKQIGSQLSMCHECAAGSARIPFEDASHQAEWQRQLWPSRPWNPVPDIAAIPFDDITPEKVLRRDLFHNSKLGLLRDFVGSSILILIHLGYFFWENAPNNRDVCLERCYAHFLMYTKTVGKRAALRSFTATFLNAKTQAEFGWISSKGSDTTILVKWLRILSKGCLQDPRDASHRLLLHHMNLAANCVVSWQRILYSHGNWLPRHCAMVVFQELRDFLDHYNSLSFISMYTFQFPGFAKKAKYHMVAHTKYELGVLIDSGVKLLPNPLMHGCEMNEDVIGKLARLSRRTSSRTTTMRTLHLYLAKAKAVYKRFLKQKKQ